jgi:hypothetical protein
VCLSVRLSGGRIVMQPQLWVGEAGGASGGGRPGLTDSYSSGLWWLPALGEKALSGHSVYCRQDLVGGDYGLLHDDFPWNVASADTAAAKQKVITRPDFWSGLLFKRLMGDGVLATTVSAATEAAVSTDTLLSYCHCSRRFAKGLALLMVNPTTANTSVAIEFATVGDSRWHAVMYELSEGTAPTDIKLNGRLLSVTESAAGEWLMPSLEGRNISTALHHEQSAGQQPAAALTVDVEQRSYLFLEFPHANVAACAQH